MSFDNILHEITSGLTGDQSNDVKYLMEQSEKYKDNEYSQEILRAIGRIIHDIVPEELKNKFANEFNNFHISIEKTLEEVDFLMYKNDFRKALEMIEALVKKIEEMGFYKDDAVSEYHCFNNFLEEIIYRELFNPQKAIRIIEPYYPLVYFKYGNLLFEYKKFIEARAALEIAEKYNPIDVNIKIELAETYKVEKNWDKFLSINKRIYDCSYTNEDLCRYYRNLGYYYIEKGNYDVAISVYILSILFLEKTDIPETATAENQRTMQLNMAKNQLAYIAQQSGKNFDIDDNSMKNGWRLSPRWITKDKTEWVLELLEEEVADTKLLSISSVSKCLSENNIPFGTNPKILTILKDIGQDAIYKNENVFARFVYKSLFNLTNNELYLRVIKSLPKTDRKKETTKKNTAKKTTTKKNEPKDKGKK